MKVPAALCSSTPGGIERYGSQHAATAGRPVVIAHPHGIGLRGHDRPSSARMRREVTPGSTAERLERRRAGPALGCAGSRATTSGAAPSVPTRCLALGAVCGHFELLLESSFRHYEKPSSRRRAGVMTVEVVNRQVNRSADAQCAILYSRVSKPALLGVVESLAFHSRPPPKWLLARPCTQVRFRRWPRGSRTLHTGQSDTDSPPDRAALPRRPSRELVRRRHREGRRRPT